MSDGSGGPKPPLIPTGAVKPPDAAGIKPAAGGPDTRKTSGMAIAGFVLAFLPILCINVVGVILGIVALVQIGNKPQQLKGQGLAIAAIVIGSLWFVIGILAAIAIPNFLMFQARAKQSEAKINLKVIYTQEKMIFAETGEMAAGFRQLDWTPDGTTRYTYYLGDETIEATEGTGGDLPDGVVPFVEGERFRAVAVGNIDGDETLDVWVIDDENNLENVVNDVEE